MRAHEFLRSLADMLDSKDSEQQSTIKLQPVDVDHSDGTDPETMVPPLQQKHELLKKATGVPSHFDDECNEQPDELDQIRRSAGLNTTQLFIASDGDDLELE